MIGRIKVLAAIKTWGVIDNSLKGQWRRTITDILETFTSMVNKDK